MSNRIDEMQTGGMKTVKLMIKLKRESEKITKLFF